MAISGEARLAGAGIRPTPQRLRVLGALADEADGATAQELHHRLRRRGDRIGLATVYRALAALHEHDVIDSLPQRTGESRYRVCGSDRHHHHLVCRACDRVIELSGCDVDDWIRRVSAAHGFRELEHSLEVTGLCADCR